VSAADAPRSPAFVFERQVRFEEVDAARIVFFARFLGYAHDAMVEFFGQLPGGYVGLINDRAIGLPAVHVECDFVAPLRFGDVARIHVTAARIGRSSCTFRYAMSRKRDGARVAEISHVCVTSDLTTMTSVPIPPDIRTLLERHLVPDAPSAQPHP